jgi:hypothetical protein
MEAAMFGDDASRCSNGLTAQKFREATAEERIVYRRWLRGVVAVYGVLFLLSGIIVAASYSGAGLTQLSKLSERQSAVARR